MVSLILVASPFLFYTYRYAPREPSWDTIFGTIESGSFTHVRLFLHSLFTKLILVLLTGIWFLTSKNWWKYAILVPFTMFLFQLSGVMNFKNKYIDEYDFWYSLPVTLPIVAFLIYISLRINKRASEKDDLKDDVDEEIKNIFSDKL
ncbi:MAG: hypothetical protein AAFP76_10325 [Bacteroidota bacterium]